MSEELRDGETLPPGHLGPVAVFRHFRSGAAERRQRIQLHPFQRIGREFESLPVRAGGNGELVVGVLVVRFDSEDFRLGKGAGEEFHAVLRGREKKGNYERNNRHRDYKFKKIVTYILF